MYDEPIIGSFPFILFWTSRWLSSPDLQSYQKRMLLTICHRCSASRYLQRWFRVIRLGEARSSLFQLNYYWTDLKFHFFGQNVKSWSSILSEKNINILSSLFSFSLSPGFDRVISRVKPDNKKHFRWKKSRTRLIDQNIEKRQIGIIGNDQDTYNHAIWSDFSWNFFEFSGYQAFKNCINLNLLFVTSFV